MVTVAMVTVDDGGYGTGCNGSGRDRQSRTGAIPLSDSNNLRFIFAKVREMERYRVLVSALDWSHFTLAAVLVDPNKSQVNYKTAL